MACRGGGALAEIQVWITLPESRTDGRDFLAFVYRHGDENACRGQQDRAGIHDRLLCHRNSSHNRIHGVKVNPGPERQEMSEYAGNSDIEHAMEKEAAAHGAADFGIIQVFVRIESNIVFQAPHHQPGDTAGRGCDDNQRVESIDQTQECEAQVWRDTSVNQKREQNIQENYGPARKGGILQEDFVRDGCHKFSS